MKTLLTVIGLLLAISAVHCIVMREASGDIKSSRTGKAVYKIVGKKEEKVVLRIDDLKLNKGSSLKIKVDKGELRVLTMVGSQIKQMIKNRRSRTTATVTLPITITTEKQKLTLKYNGVGGAKTEVFSAHYAIFKEEGNCKKDILRDDHSDSTSIDCDADELSLVASQCNIVYNCDENHVQKSQSVACDSESWDGEVTCQPRDQVMARCSFDFDKFTVNNVCPFSIQEIVDYYVEFDSYEAEESEISVRSTGRSLNCSSVCAVNQKGQRRRCKRSERVPCLVCRVKHRCRVTWAFY